MQNANARWEELKFYFLITDILLKHQNFEDVSNLIKICSLYGKYSVEEGINLAKTILLKDNFRPTKEELISLALCTNAPREWVRHKTKIGYRKYYAIKNKMLSDPPNFITRLTTSEIVLAKEINKSYEQLRKVGAPYEYRGIVGKIQKHRHQRFGDESLRLS